MLISLSWIIFVKWVALAVAGHWLINTLARPVQPAWIRRLFLTSYWVRLVVGAVGFLISYFHWPIMRELHLHRGFWAFGIDATVYHHFSRLIADAWQHGLEIPDPELGVEYFIVIASVYTLLGQHPLYGIALNTVFTLLTALLGYRLGRRLFGDSTATLGAALIACWPSTLAWSSQLLKDCFSWLMIFTVLELLMIALERADPAPFGKPAPRRRAVLIGLLAATFVMTRLRFYLGFALCVSTCLVLLPAAVSSWWADQRERAIQLGWIPVLLSVTVVGSRMPNMREVFCPVHAKGLFLLIVSGAVATIWLSRARLVSVAMLARNRWVRTAITILLAVGAWRLTAIWWHAVSQIPRDRHMAVAWAALDHGQTARAESEFLAAMRADQNFQDAYLGLAAVALRVEKPTMALTVYSHYFRLRQLDGNVAGQVGNLMEQLGLRQGAWHFRRGQFAEAAASYQMALDAKPAIARNASNLGLALARAGDLTRAEEVLGQATSLWADIDTSLLIRSLRDAVKRAVVTGEAEPLLSFEPFGPEMADEAMVDMAQKISRMAISRESAWNAWQIVCGLGRFDEYVADAAREVRPESLGNYRRNFVITGGHSLLDPWATISSTGKLLAYVPRALSIGLLAPFPWQWAETKGSTGIMRAVASLDMALWYLLLPALVAGALSILRGRRLGPLLLLSFGLVAILPISLVVANLGTLFRLRLQALLPLLLVASYGDPIGRWRGLAKRLGLRWRAKSIARSVDRSLPRPVSQAPALPSSGAHS